LRARPVQQTGAPSAGPVLAGCSQPRGTHRAWQSFYFVFEHKKQQDGSELRHAAANQGKPKAAVTTLASHLAAAAPLRSRLASLPGLAGDFAVRVNHARGWRAEGQGEQRFRVLAWYRPWSVQARFPPAGHTEIRRP